MLRHMELTIMRAGKKNLQSSRLPRISTILESFPRYLANTRVSDNESIDNKEV